MSNQVDRVTVEDLIDGGIIEGFQRGIQSFMENINEAVGRDVVLSESGGAEEYLQSMLDATIEEQETNEVHANMSELTSKLSKVLK
jgi:2-hydroxy-3-keto-5-methylthiopentenyl-1-phosphate phosphatase